MPPAVPLSKPMMRPRFGIDGRWLTGGPPSGVNYVRNVVGELAAGPHGANYVVFGRAGSAAHVPPNGVMRVQVLPGAPSLVFNAAVIPMRARRGVDAVLFQNFTPPRATIAAVTVIHDLIFMTNPSQFTWAERAYLAFIPALLPRARLVVAVSEHIRCQVLEHWPDRDPATVVVAPNAVSEKLLKAAAAGVTADDRARRARLGVTAPYLLYVGRLNRRKNLARLIRAFSASGLADHDLVLAGAASGASEDLASIARRAGVLGRVHLIGRVDDDDLPALFREAAAFAYVSLDEGFGVPPLEAMAFGIPVVCSDIPALRETGGDGGALFAPPLDEGAIAGALVRAVTDSTVIAEARARGPVHAGRYRWSETTRILNQTMELALT